VETNEKIARLDTCLGSILLSAIVWGLTILLGYMWTPPATYNEPMGGLALLFVFGFAGALGAFFNYVLTLAVLRSWRLDPLSYFPKFCIAAFIAACLCVAATYAGVVIMEQPRTPYVG